MSVMEKWRIRVVYPPAPKRSEDLLVFSGTCQQSCGLPSITVGILDYLSDKSGFPGKTVEGLNINL